MYNPNDVDNFKYLTALIIIKNTHKLYFLQKYL